MVKIIVSWDPVLKSEAGEEGEVEDAHLRLGFKGIQKMIKHE